MNEVNENELYTLSPSPHVKHPDTTATIMRDVVIALVPALVWSVIVFGIRALLVTLLSIGFCVFFEFAFQKFVKKTVTISDLSAVVTGIILAFNLPPTIPIWALAAGAFFAIIVVKQIYGGIGKNIVNPAISARIFMFISWPTEMTVFNEPFTDAVSSATPLAIMKTGVLPDTGILDMFFGKNSGCIGEVSVLLLLIGGVYLFIRRIITWHIPVCYILTVSLFALLFPKAGGNFEYLAYALFSGGLILGAFFMATDYTTSPVTKKGRIIFGVGCGLLTVLFRYFGTYPEGVSFAIMIMNFLVWFLDRFTAPIKFGEKKKQ